MHPNAERASHPHSKKNNAPSGPGAGHVDPSESALAQVRFGELRDNVIMPVMLEIGAKTQAKGVDYQIKMEDSAPFRTTMKFAVGPDEKGIETQPEFVVMFAPPFEFVSFQVNDTSDAESSSGGAIRPAGDMPFEDVTKDVVRQKLQSLLRRVL